MVEKQQKKAQSHRYYISWSNASTVPTRKPQKSQNKHKHNACKEPWPQDEKHDISKTVAVSWPDRVLLDSVRAGRPCLLSIAISIASIVSGAYDSALHSFFRFSVGFLALARVSSVRIFELLRGLV